MPYVEAMSNKQPIPAAITAATKRRAHIKERLEAIEEELTPLSTEKMTDYARRLEADLPRQKQYCLAFKGAQDLVGCSCQLGIYLSQLLSQ